MTEPRDVRLKRLKIRAWHRGIKEMDLILGNFTDDRMAEMPDSALDRLELVMAENDHDIYQWVTGQAETPPQFADMIAEIALHAGASRDQA